MSNYKEDLCIYDPQNPLSNANPEHGYPTDDDPEPRRKDCSCDNCFYGRDKLALRILKLQAEIRASSLRELKLQFENEELQAQLAAKECVWTKSQIGLGLSWDEYDSWSTSCGEDFAIIAPWHENPTPYCSNCGGKTITAIKGDDDDAGETHCCGLTGFNQMLGDRCPLCNAGDDDE